MMSTALDLEIAAAVDELFAEFGGGVSATLTPIDGTYDAATNATSGDTAPVAVKCTPPAEYSAALVDGENVLAGDLVVVLKGAGLALAPQAGWRFTVVGKVFRIITAKRLSAGDDVAAWELQLRR